MNINAGPAVLRSVTVDRAPASRRAPALAALLVLAVAFTGVRAGGMAIPALAPLAVAIVLVAAAGELIAGITLIAISHVQRVERGIVLLALALCGGALLAALIAFVLPLGSSGATIFPVPRQAEGWLIFCEQAGFGLVALAYPLLRASGADGGVSGAFGRRAAAGVAAYAIASVALAVGFADRLPPVSDGTQTGVLLLCAAGAWRVARIKPRMEIDQAFAMMLFAFAVQIGVTLARSSRFTIGWYVSLVIVYVASLTVVAAAVRMLAWSRRSAERAGDERARQAERIRLLGGIASITAADSRTTIVSIVETAADSLRPGSPMCAVLCHLAGGQIVVDAVAWSGAARPAPESGVLEPGALVALRRRIFVRSSPIARTLVVNDADAPPIRRMTDVHTWRSLIVTPVATAGARRYLAIGSFQTISEQPFGDDDIGYVEVLASLIAKRWSEEHAPHGEPVSWIAPDRLTALHSRASFDAALHDAIVANVPFAVALVALDNLPAINEAAGRATGDDLLLQTASALAAVDRRDFVARVSGDEFAILCRNVTSADEARRRVARYARVFRKPFRSEAGDARVVALSASVGAARFPLDGADGAAMRGSATVALGAAKERGGSAVLFFDRTMEERSQDVYLTGLELADAIDADGLSLVYQPTFDLASGAMVGAEALVRWNHTTRGLLLPKDFITCAMRSGLMGRLSRWVMGRVIDDVGRLHLGDGRFRCYFNLATTQIDDPTFIEELEWRLAKNPGVAEHLGIEITESAMFGDVAASLHALERFHQLGLCTAIDDFGTGYSSLSYLKRLPVDMIKVDRSFVAGLPDDDKDAALCDLLLSIARRFGFKTLAEGVETQAQWNWLNAHACDYGQGYHLARPVPFYALSALLAARTATHAGSDPSAIMS